MKMTHLLTTHALSNDLPETQNPLPLLSPVGSGEDREILRYICLRNRLIASP
ncbi:MAG: hypothetical protein AAFV85_11055 [Cyanobacteria bacterium J06634_6]